MSEIHEIEELIRKERDAHEALTAACEKRWPKGTRVYVMLRSGQIVASKATIVWFDGDEARVRLDANKRRHGRVIEGLHSFKYVSYTAIVGEPEGRAE